MSEAERVHRCGCATLATLDDALRGKLAKGAVADPWSQLRCGLALGLNDIGSGRTHLRAAADDFAACGDTKGRLLACSAQLVFIGIADDNYTGFEGAADFLVDVEPAAFEWADAGDRLLAEVGALLAGSFHALDAPSLGSRVAHIEASLADASIAVALRCCAGLVALQHHHIRMQLERVLWIELSMRPLLADPALPERLADEAFHLFVMSLYQCEAPGEAQAVRQRRFGLPRPLLPVIELKLALLDAQMALGAGDPNTGRGALDRAEPLLDSRAPRAAGWWHLLRSRLALLDGRQRQALIHARLARRLTTESHLPERWMGVTMMQEGQVLVAGGAYLEAVPFFERAGRAASGSQARFCWALAHLTRALHFFDHHDALAGRVSLSEGLVTARELAWLQFFRACPVVAATVCARAVEHGVETGFVREVIATRHLQSVRSDLADWPWPIRVRTFGGLRIELDGHALGFKGKVAKKPLQLLLFLIASGGSEVSVSSAAFGLWPELDGDKARAALTAALHRLRKLLGSDAVLLQHGRLSLDLETVWVDCLAFEQLADSVGLPAAGPLAPTARNAAERALALYTSAFLHDAEDEAWQLTLRARLAGKAKRMIMLLAAAAAARGESGASRALLERGLELDPLAEDLARELMNQLINAGEQAAALLVFERCRLAIGERLGALPSPATLALREAMRGSH